MIRKKDVKANIIKLNIPSGWKRNNIMINVVDIGSINNDCLCRECLNDPKTPNKFKRGLY